MHSQPGSRRRGVFESVAEQGARIAEALSQRTGGDPLASMLFAAGALLLTLWAMLSLRRRLRRRAAGEGSSQSVSRATRVDRQRAELEQLMVDAEELVRRLAALLDNKAARAEQLLDRLERRLRDLERAGSCAPSTAAEAAPASVLESATAAPTDPLREEVVRLAGEGLAPVEIARRLNEQVGKVELILALHRA